MHLCPGTYTLLSLLLLLLGGIEEMKTEIMATNSLNNHASVRAGYNIF